MSAQVYRFRLIFGSSLPSIKYVRCGYYYWRNHIVTRNLNLVTGMDRIKSDVDYIPDIRIYFYSVPRILDIQVANEVLYAKRHFNLLKERCTVQIRLETPFSKNIYLRDDVSTEKINMRNLKEFDTKKSCLFTHFFFFTSVLPYIFHGTFCNGECALYVN